MTTEKYGIYSIAGLRIGISSLYDDVHRLCAGYEEKECSGDADICVGILDEDIENERLRSAEEHERQGIPVRDFPDPYLETLAVYRKIAEKLPYHDAFLMHGSCVAAEGTGYLFTAKSGTGKSTHTRLWREYLGDRAVMVNDDKPVIRFVEEGPVVCGTPWNGKHRLGSNITVPLGAICLLERGAENKITEESFAGIYPALLGQIYRPHDRKAFGKTLELIDRLAPAVRMARLWCNMEPEAAEVSCAFFGITKKEDVGGIGRYEIV